MSKVCKYLLMITMIIFVCIQVFLINKINTSKNVIVYNTQKSINTPKTFKEVSRELSCLKEKNIISAKKINKKWFIELKIKGSKEELMKEISKLKNYDISNYIISRNEGKNSIILKISDKEST